MPTCQRCNRFASRDALSRGLCQWCRGEDRQDAASPTPEQIVERAAAIRAGWSEEEKRKRDTAPRSVPYTIPEIETPPEWWSNHDWTA